MFTCSYDLLRTAEGNNKKLSLIPLPSGGYNVTYVKSIASQAKVYIRPLQKDLSMSILTSDVVSVSAYCYIIFIIVLFFYFLDIVS